MCLFRSLFWLFRFGLIIGPACRVCKLLIVCGMCVCVGVCGAKVFYKFGVCAIFEVVGLAFAKYFGVFGFVLIYLS